MNWKDRYEFIPITKDSVINEGDHVKLIKEDDDFWYRGNCGKIFEVIGIEWTSANFSIPCKVYEKDWNFPFDEMGDDDTREQVEKDFEERGWTDCFAATKDVLWRKQR